MFTTIDFIGESSVEVTEKTESTPLVEDLYAKAGFTEEQLVEIEDLRRRYSQFGTLFIDRTSPYFADAEDYAGRGSKQENVLFFEGRESTTMILQQV